MKNYQGSLLKTWFTGAPYMAGMCVHYTKMYLSSLLMLHTRLVHAVHHVGEVEVCGCLIIWMDREIKSSLDEGGNRPEQGGQQKHLSEVSI